MDKCKEAFEQIPEIKDSLSENIVFTGNKYTTANKGFYDLVNWLNGGWYTWQSRQAELDQLNEVLDERTKEWLEAIECGTYFKEVAKPLKDKVDQLQSQINEMAEVGLSQESELNKKDEHAHNLYYENANLQTLVEEKDKRIEKALAIVSKMAKATNSTVMWAYDLEKALRGEHE
ncbi:hypothetical protein [Acinetobacter bereziniae]|uniref:hypothetical protein n=1 Tax=Acinetobacter bereziniae TaxID=106648 RepID=UPI00300A0B7F